MSDKTHQTNKSEYQVRVDGKPVYRNGCMSRHTFTKYRDACNENPSCYVDIVRVSTDIILSQATYHDFKRHFVNSTEIME
jgi:hypothetical protein